MVFISYKHDDKTFATRLRKRIDEAGLPTWMDTDIKAGEEWKPAIDNAIKRSDALVVIVTPNSLISPYVTYEWSFALGLKKLIIPLILEFPNHSKFDWHPKEIHPKLYDLQRFDFSNPKKLPWDDLITRLQNIDIEEDIPDAIRLAKNQIHDTDITIKKKGMDLLERHPHLSATKLLEKTVEDEFSETSAMAGIALAKKSGYRNLVALQGLRNALDIHQFRQETLNILTNIKSPGVVDVLSDFFDDLISKNMDTQSTEVMRAAVQIKDPSVLPLLIKMLRTPGTIDSVIIDAAAEFKDPQVIPAFDDFLRNRQVGGEGKAKIASAIRTIAHPDGIDILEYILKSLPRLYYGEDIGAYMAAIDALAIIGGARAYTILKTAEMNMNFAEHRQPVWEALNRIRYKP